MLLDVWRLAIGAAFVGTFILACIYRRGEGRPRLYLSAFLFAVALEHGVAFLTAVGTEVIASPWFIWPRIISRSLVATTATAFVLYHLGVLNGKGEH